MCISESIKIRLKEKNGEGKKLAGYKMKNRNGI